MSVFDPVTHCPICPDHPWLEDTSRGAVCTATKELHGRIYPRLEGTAARDSKRYHATKELPAPELLPCEMPIRDGWANRLLYVFPGETGIWRLLTLEGARTYKDAKEARDGNYRRRYYQRDRELEALILPAFVAMSEEEQDT